MQAETSAEPPSKVGQVDWPALVARIEENDPSGLEELYAIFSKGVRFYMCRQLGVEELDDRVHDTFLAVVNAIQRGDLREPERLMGFVRTVVRRQVAFFIQKKVASRREHEIEDSLQISDYRESPEAEFLNRERRQFMVGVLRSLSERDQEILTRFYLSGESPDQICETMDLTPTQFRLLKTRAKARFGETGKKRLMRRAGEVIKLAKGAGA